MNKNKNEEKKEKKKKKRKCLILIHIDFFVKKWRKMKNGFFQEKCNYSFYSKNEVKWKIKKMENILNKQKM